MKFDYCPYCGAKTVLREMGDDGAVPYCAPCARPLFDMFSTCVLSVVVNEQDEILLIKQTYGQQEHYVGVAGYMQPGETAEQAALREIAEEIGLRPYAVSYAFSEWHAAKGQLMLCFIASAKKTECTLSGEVREYRWFTPAEAQQAVRPGSIIGALVSAAQKNLEKGLEKQREI